MRNTPFIAQDSAGNCGAAALAMVLGRYGVMQSPEKISVELSTIGPNGMPRIRTHRLADYARNLGLSAMVTRLEEPWKALVRSAEADFGVIINHRIDRLKPTGHFSVLAQLDQEAGQAVLNDPQNGPNLKKSREELLELWSPNFQGSQIAGFVAVVIAERPLGGVSGLCAHCNDSQANQNPKVCKGCFKVIEPLPGHVLGCLSGDCLNRLWMKIFCPTCDRVWVPDPIIRKKMAIPEIKSMVEKPETVIETGSVKVDAVNEKELAEEAIPEAGASLIKLAEAVKSLPLPDLSGLAELVETQRATLLALAEGSPMAAEISDRARDWTYLEESAKQDSSKLMDQKNAIANELTQSGSKLKQEVADQKSKLAMPMKLPEIPEEIDGGDEVEPELEKELPSGHELVRRLMARFKK